MHTRVIQEPEHLGAGEPCRLCLPRPPAAHRLQESMQKRIVGNHQQRRANGRCKRSSEREGGKKQEKKKKKKPQTARAGTSTYRPPRQKQRDVAGEAVVIDTRSTEPIGSYATTKRTANQRKHRSYDAVVLSKIGRAHV